MVPRGLPISLAQEPMRYFKYNLKGSSLGIEWELEAVSHPGPQLWLPVFFILLIKLQDWELVFGKNGPNGSMVRVSN